MKAFDAVLFDLDDTLLDGDAAWVAGLAEMCRRCPDVPAEPAFTAWHDVFADPFEAYLRGESTLEESRRERVRQWWQTLNIAAADDEVDAWWADYERGYVAGWSRFPDVDGCLAGLAGIPIGLITNGDSDQQRAKVLALGLDGVVSVVVVSGDLGYAKPDPRIFRYAAQALSVEPERCLFVGDRLDADVAGALSAGMQAVWLNRRALEVPAGIASIAGLDELEPLLAQLHTR
jgi:putative hydrolase of the HAD superfamily